MQNDSDTSSSGADPKPESTPPEATPRTGLSRSIKEILVFLRQRVSLDEDKADPQETIDYIKKGIEFRGTNVWILVFAILVASIGLNMNSAAVIIGAMLISPLMGPIMGVGMGVGINDFDLIKRSGKNLGLMVGISVLTSTIYFFLTPLNDAQSELLARTTPTIWDVLIAIFGGLAGIVAGSRREKSNAIPGVAIATALMPPLCTAGYGIATGNLSYFLGAFYLFTINSVFISLSTTIIVRFLKYPTRDFVDAAREKRVKRWIAGFVIIVILPSLFIAYNLVRESVFQREAGVFITENFVFDQAQVISKNVVVEGENKRIEVALIGQPISSETIKLLENKLKQNSRLSDAVLVVRQGPINDAGLDMETVQLMNQSMKTGIIEDLYKRNEDVIQSKDEQIKVLENEIYKLKSHELPIDDISAELKAQHENVKEFTLMRNPIVNMDSMRIDTVTFAYVHFKKRPKKEETDRLESWLKARCKAESLRLVIQVD
ncbi:MAG: TIGR00341 family protein [Flavobacteriales bacterium]|nr:TIGR00341 family protein [Flavobacteriales bacterium]